MSNFTKYYQEQYEKIRISRREFVGRLTAAGVAAATTGTLLAASNSVIAATPEKGRSDAHRGYTHSANDTLNPNRLTTSLDFMRPTRFAVRSCVTARTSAQKRISLPSGTLRTISKTWRFKIRNDAVFHNGKTLGVQDCIYSLGRHLGEDSDSIIKAWLATIQEMKKDGDWLVLNLDAPNADLPMYLGDMHAVIMPDGHTDFDNMIGTGPFKVESFRPGVGMLGVRNDDYHHEGFPYVDEVESFGIGDTAARVNALLAGDIHITVRVDPKSIPIIEANPGTNMAASPSSRHLTYAMASDREPTSNHDLRQALRLMVNREAVLKNIQKGYGAVGNDTPIGPADLYYCPDIPQRVMDLDKAKFHLKKAGMEGGNI